MDINEKINNIIRNHISEETKIVPFLMELLNLSRESTYRRLRGEVPYTIQEVSILFSKINFAAEEVFGSNNNAYFCLNMAKSTSPSNDYVEMMKNTISVFQDIRKEQLCKVYYVGNMIPNYMFLQYDMLSKLRYMKWVHQSHNLSIDTKFSDLIVPSKVDEIHKEYRCLSKKIGHFTVIFDNNIVQAVINTIKYYSRRNMFSVEEILEMKRELLLLVRSIENILLTGRDMYNLENEFYLSDLNIDSNLLFFEFEQKMSAHFLSTGKVPLVTTNLNVCEEQKRWIKTILKSSALMTKSNEILQAEFVKKQYSLIRKEINPLLDKYTR